MVDRTSVRLALEQCYLQGSYSDSTAPGSLGLLTSLA
jgi:hypothetical protein